MLFQKKKLQTLPPPIVMVMALPTAMMLSLMTRQRALIPMVMALAITPILMMMVMVSPIAVTPIL